MCTLLDSHVHFHPSFDASTFLDAAAANFSRAARLIAPTSSVADASFDPSRQASAMVICAIDPSEAPLAPISRAVTNCSWSVTTTQPNAIVVTRASQANLRTSDNALLLIAGRQVVTKERLELLVVGTSASFPNDAPLTSTMQAVEESGGVSILPWGFGKWLFQRGRVLRSLLSRSIGSTSLLLGDNGCRWSARRPSLLNLAESTGISILAGSDPLNLPNHVRRPGSFGSVLDVDLTNSDNIAKALCQTLLGLNETPPTFGECRSLLSFVRDQVSLRLS